MRASRAETVGRAYCSTANLGAGFDVFGLALNKYSDIVRVRLTQGRQIRILTHGPHATGLPEAAVKNSAGPPAKALLTQAGSKKGVAISIEKNVPQGVGLGSSGASAAACTKSLNHLLDLQLSDDELVRVASLGERAVSGAPHADNVAASLLGGFVVVYDDPVRVLKIRPPIELRVVVVTPRTRPEQNKTRKARILVPRRVETAKAVLNIGRASAIATGFAQGDIDTIGAGMKDEIAEPHRKEMIPGYRTAREMGLKAGASGVSISGAGPSLVALVDRSRHDPHLVAGAMVRGFAQNHVQSTWLIARAAPGASVVRNR